MYTLLTRLMLVLTRQEVFYLSIDSQALLTEAYDGKILVLTVEITNPTFMNWRKRN